MTVAQPRPLKGLAGIPDVAGDHLNAVRFLEEHGPNVRWSPELGRAYIWDGSWWQEDRLERVQELAANTIDGLRPWVAEADGPDEFRRRSAHYQRSTQAGRIDGLWKIARTGPDVVVGVGQLDAQPMTLACRNVTVDLSTGDTRAPNRDDLLTMGVGVDYDEDAFSGRWVDFLDTIFTGDTDLIAYVQRLLGYCMTGVVSEHVLPVFAGVGANGKSTLIGVVQDLLGDHAITAPEGLVIQRDHDPHPERLAILRGRRLVVSAELEKKAVLAEAMVKLLTGGDTLSARELYGRRFNFKPTYKVILVTNHAPRVRGTDHAIWRRLRVVPFGVVIPPEKQDPRLRRRLVEEDGAAVLAWLVQGAISWHQRGLGDVDSVTTATSDYRKREDTMGTWLAESTVTVEGAVTKVGELWNSWKVWTEAAGERPGRLQDFVAAIEEHGVEVALYQGTRLARGIGILVGAREGSPGTFPKSSSMGTSRTSPHEPPRQGEFEEVDG